MGLLTSNSNSSGNTSNSSSGSNAATATKQTQVLDAVAACLSAQISALHQLLPEAAQLQQQDTAARQLSSSVVLTRTPGTSSTLQRTITTSSSSSSTATAASTTCRLDLQQPGPVGAATATTLQSVHLQLQQLEQLLGVVAADGGNNNNKLLAKQRCVFCVCVVLPRRPPPTLSLSGWLLSRLSFSSFLRRTHSCHTNAVTMMLALHWLLPLA